jgi:DNA-binding transcriptional ArsR family regulator
MLEQPELDAVSLDAALRALGDPLRLRIAQTLAADGAEHTCHEFGDELSRATMTHHFRALREAGLISTRIEGRNRLIRLRDDELEQRFPGLVLLLRSAAIPQPSVATGG